MLRAWRDDYVQATSKAKTSLNALAGCPKSQGWTYLNVVDHVTTDGFIFHCVYLYHRKHAMTKGSLSRRVSERTFLAAKTSPGGGPLLALGDNLWQPKLVRGTTFVVTAHLSP